MISIRTANCKRANDSRVVNVNGKLALAGKDRGFTIIELLVVMAIIGLLAAIAIPVFSKLKNNAYDSAAQSDLRQAALQTESSFSATGAYPVDQTTAVTGWNAVVAPNVKLTTPGSETVKYAKGATGFVLSMNDSRTGNAYCYGSGAGGQKTVTTANVGTCTDAAAIAAN